MRIGVWHRPNDTGEEIDLNGIKSVLKRFKSAGIDLVFLESFYHGSAVYRSKLVPYRAELENFAYGEYKDYLSAFLAEAAKLEIEVHAWVEDFYVGVEENFFTKEKPEWLLLTKDGKTRQSEGGGYYFLDPANQEVCNYLIKIYAEILEKHPQIAGLNLDYIRYPLSSEEDDTGYTKAAIEKFGRSPEKDYEKWVDFRADAVTDFVKKVRTAFPDAVLSTAVFPEKQLSYLTKKQDFSRWLKEELLDFVTPMAYYDDLQSLIKALKEMISYCGKTPCLAGLSATFHNLPESDVCAQIDASVAEGAKGVVFFGSKSILNNEGYLKALGKKLNN